MTTMFATLIAHPALAAPAEKMMTVLFGTYGRDGKEGVYAADFDPETGELQKPRRVCQLANPGFLAFSPRQDFVYATGRGAPGTDLAAGRIAALAVDRKSGQLRLLNEVATQGGGPCHVAVHPTGRFAAVANYGTGSVEVFSLAEDGSIERQTAFVQHEGSSVDPERQKEPHAHSINFTPDGAYAFAADLGLDKVLVYRFDLNDGALRPADPSFASTPPGAGPRHLAFHPDGDEAYVVNEMGASVTSLQWNSSEGRLAALGTVEALPKGFEGQRWSAEIVVHPSARFIFCSHRGHNVVATLSLAKGGDLKFVSEASSGGEWPRNFGMDPTGRWILAANQNSGNVAVLAIDQNTGELTPTNISVEVPEPVCVRFLNPGF
ncbi:MAG: lactonase family protein [Planctomycetales bacterium]|nr:lactonase family protein [Planctomycetales bacterium]